MSTISPVTDASVYTDLQGLQSLKKGASVEDPESLRAVAQQFEGMLLSMMMKSMREANAAFEQDGYFNSNETRFYRDMYDQQFTLDMANNGGIGLTDVLVRQLSKQVPDSGKAVEAGAPLQKLGRLDRLDRLDRLSARSDAAKPPQGMESQEHLLAARQQDAAPPLQEFLEVVEERVVSAARTVREMVTSAAEEAGARVTALAEEAVAAVSGESSGMLGSAIERADAVASAAKTFSSPAEFVKKLYPLAEHAAEQIGVNPKALIAQAALETGWGRHVIRSAEDSSFNLFGIKADSRWQGDRQSVNTLEYRDGIPEKVRDAFRSYQSYAESFMDYAKFIQENPRYQQALEVAADPEAYLEALQDAGYATDPAYASKIKSILSGDLLEGALEGLR